MGDLAILPVEPLGFDVHPAASVFPLMTGAEFDALCADIKAHGQRETIKRVWVEHEAGNGMRKPLVLDGRNRLRACVKLGIAPRYADYEGDDHVEYVLSANLCRRHLNESQRALVAARIATLPRGNRPTGLSEVPTQSAAAKMLNVGDRSVRRARQVMETASPEVVERVAQGEISVHEAARIAASNANEQRAAVRPAETRTVGNGGRESKSTGAKAEERRLVAERDERVKELVHRGLGVREIAETLGVEPNHGRARRHSVRAAGGEHEEGASLMREPSTAERMALGLFLAWVALICASTLPGCATVATVAAGLWAFGMALSAGIAIALLAFAGTVVALAAVDELRASRAKRKSERWREEENAEIASISALNDTNTKDFL